MVKKTNKRSNAVSWIILILGALLLLYPIAATLSTQYRPVSYTHLTLPTKA